VLTVLFILRKNWFIRSEGHWDQIRDQHYEKVKERQRATKARFLQLPQFTLCVPPAFFVLSAGVKSEMIDLLISAEVENVQKLGVPANHTFFVKLRCVNCNDITPNAIGVSRDMEVEGIRGASVNLQAMLNSDLEHFFRRFLWPHTICTIQVKCKGCGRVHDVSLVPEEKEDDAGYVAESEEWQRLATFDCRGMDPVAHTIPSTRCMRPIPWQTPGSNCNVLLFALLLHASFAPSHA
jgi:hypothetical protein